MLDADKLDFAGIGFCKLLWDVKVICVSQEFLPGPISSWLCVVYWDKWDFDCLVYCRFIHDDEMVWLELCV